MKNILYRIFRGWTPKTRCSDTLSSGQTRVRNSATLTEWGGDPAPSIPPPPPGIWQQGGHTVTGAPFPLAFYFPSEISNY